MWARSLAVLFLLAAAAHADQAGGLGVSINARVASTPPPVIVSTIPADGSTIGTASPPLRIIFNVDMDTTRTDITKVLLPAGMTPSQLVWVDLKTLDILYTGFMTSFGAKRVDLTDRYFRSVSGTMLPNLSGYAFNYSPNNGAPIIATPATATPTLTGVGDSVGFSAAVADPDGDPLTYIWNFGDGSPTLSGQNVTHVYTTLGTYTAIVTVSDGRGGTIQSQVVVTVSDGGGKPIMISSVPADGSSVTTPGPNLSVNFNVDMDTTKVDFTKVGLPAPLKAISLTWTGKRTLSIQYQGVLDAFGAKRVDLNDMYFVNTVNEAIPLGSGFAFEYENPNHSPFIVQGPSADPGVAVGGNPIKFTALGFDQDNDTLTYTWDFGDNTTGTGMPATHTYTLSGSYLVTLTVSDGRGGSATGALLLGALASAPWNVTRAMIGLNFKTGKDKIQIQGVADMPPGFDPTGKKVSVNVGGNIQNYTLDKRGAGKTGKDQFRLTRKLKKKVFLGGACKIRFTLSGLLATQLADEGLISVDTPKIGLHLVVDVNMVIDGRPFIGRAPILYKAKLGKTGRGKLTTAIK